MDNTGPRPLAALAKIVTRRAENVQVGDLLMCAAPANEDETSFHDALRRGVVTADADIIRNPRSHGVAAHTVGSQFAARVAYIGDDGHTVSLCLSAGVAHAEETLEFAHGARVRVFVAAPPPGA